MCMTWAFTTLSVFVKAWETLDSDNVDGNTSDNELLNRRDNLMLGESLARSDRGIDDQTGAMAKRSCLPRGDPFSLLDRRSSSGSPYRHTARRCKSVSKVK